MHYLVSRVRVSMAAPVAHERVIYSAMGPTLDSPWVIRPAFEKRVSYKKPWNFISRVIIFGVALISRIFMVFGAGRIRVNGGDAFLNLLRTTRYKQGLITGVDESLMGGAMHMHMSDQWAMGVHKKAHTMGILW